MRFIFISIFLFIVLNCYGQYSIKGEIVDYKNKEPIYFAAVAIYNLDQNIHIKTNFTNLSGQFYCDSLIEGKYKIEITYLGYHCVIIDQIFLKQNIDLCKIFIYQRSTHADGVNSSIVYPGYLEKHTKKGKIKLKYFCNQVIEGNFDNGMLLIEFKTK